MSFGQPSGSRLLYVQQYLAMFNVLMPDVPYSGPNAFLS
jgi:hypothetical protein